MEFSSLLFCPYNYFNIYIKSIKAREGEEKSKFYYGISSA